jgi:ABC-type nickel/cobalt efflux system permease component RcnA
MSAALLPQQIALAHPLGNFSVNHYTRIEVSPSQIQLFYVVDLAEIPTFQLKKAIDGNANNQIDPDEQQAYVAGRVEELVNGVSLKVDGAAVALKSRAPELRFSPGQGGLETMRLSFWMDGALPALGDEIANVVFKDTNDVARLGWREIVLRATGGVAVTNASVSDKDVSNELSNYPADLLNSPLKQTEATFSMKATGGASAVSGAKTSDQTPVFGQSDTSSQLAGLINYRDLTPQVIVLTLLTAFGLGALHALEPGHGKSVAAAYLVGTRATPKHAVLLGATVTITHTFSVFLLGLVTLFLSSYIVPEKLFPYLGLLSAAIVIVMGVSMIINALRQRAASDSIATDHNHEFDPNTNQLVHAHGGKQHTHVPPAKMNARNVLAVGVSGGLVPCPGALIVMLSAIALGRVGFGMILIVVFSLGLAGVLTGISLALVYSKRALSKSSFASRLNALIPKDGKLIQLMPVFSGVLVIGAGCLLLYYALPFLQLF